ncbi:MAG: RagB/SusD family nutrient uptake outer membrane protein [Ginsengibacter sp.]
MNKQFIFKIILPVLAGLSLINISCKKYIDQGPINSTYGAKFWTSQASVEQATLAMYGQLRNCLRASGSTGNDGGRHEEASIFVNGDLVAGTFLPIDGTNLSYSLSANSDNGPFNFSYVPYGESVLQNWSRFYQLIAQCNLILKNVPAMSSSLFESENKKNSYISEALFMRAYTYFYITRIWGDPVYVTKSYDDVDYGNIPPVARTPEAIVLDSCINDLKTAAAALTYTFGDPSKTIRANKGSLYSLLAHIYAWKHDYKNAHIACQEVIKNGGYSLEPMSTYKNIWKDRMSAESIFEIAMTYNPSDPNFADQNDWAEAKFYCFASFLKGPVVDNQTSQCWISPKGAFIDAFLDTSIDLRYNTAYEYVPASGGDDEGYLMMKYTEFNYQKPETKTLPYLNNNLVLFRLSDIYLLDAEALAYNGDLEGARAALSMTEDRAGISSYTAPTSAYDMLDEIVIERGREMTGEGSFFYDLVRTEPTQGWLEYVGYQADRVLSVNKGYYWPLDMGALFPQDKLLVQNPWWITHK